uniref:RAP domain-containing protein n=1 Tax=Parastrongyloides trichosuri TaxID=131310 RepID=A0A0N4ZBM6_PARTI
MAAQPENTLSIKEIFQEYLNKTFFKRGYFKDFSRRSTIKQKKEFIKKLAIDLKRFDERNLLTDDTYIILFNVLKPHFGKVTNIMDMDDNMVTFDNRTSIANVIFKLSINLPAAREEIYGSTMISAFLNYKSGSRIDNIIYEEGLAEFLNLTIGKVQLTTGIHKDPLRFINSYSNILSLLANDKNLIEKNNVVPYTIDELLLYKIKNMLTSYTGVIKNVFKNIKDINLRKDVNYYKTLWDVLTQCNNDLYLIADHILKAGKHFIDLDDCLFTIFKNHLDILINLFDNYEILNDYDGYLYVIDQGLSLTKFLRRFVISNLTEKNIDKSKFEKYLTKKLILIDGIYIFFGAHVGLPKEYVDPLIDWIQSSGLVEPVDYNVHKTIKNYVTTLHEERVSGNRIVSKVRDLIMCL